MTGPIPTDYDKDDGFSNEQGCEVCPHCDEPWSMNGGMQGPAYTQSGREYEYYLDADPGKGPFFCEECYDELETNKRQKENSQLGEWCE